MIENETEIAEASQFVPLTDEQIAKANADLEAAAGSLLASTDVTAGAGRCSALDAAGSDEDVIKGVLVVCALISVATTVGIVIALFMPAFEFFQEIPIRDFLTGTNWSPLFEPASFGVLHSWRHAARHRDREHRRDASRPRGGDLPERVRVTADARIPEAGFRGSGGDPDDRLRLFRAHLHDAAPARSGINVDIFNTLSAGLVIGVMLMPTVASLSEDAMAAVPRDLRDGAYALGSTKVQVATPIVRARRPISGSSPRSCSRSRGPSGRP